MVTSHKTVTAILSWVPSKTQIKQRFVTNYSSRCCLDFTMHIEDFYKNTCSRNSCCLHMCVHVCVCMCVCVCVCELACICVGGEWRKMEQESCTMTKLLIIIILCSSQQLPHLTILISKFPRRSENSYLCNKINIIVGFLCYKHSHGSS